MQHAILDLGGAALVPELGADVAAGGGGERSPVFGAS